MARLRVLEGPLTVRHHCEMSWATAHSTRRAQLADGFRPLAGPIGNQSDGFPDDADPAAPSPRRPGMTPGRLGFVVGQRAGRNQVRGNPISTLLAQPAKVTTHFEIQCVCGRPLRHVRPCLADVFFAPAGTAFRFALDEGPRIAVLAPVVRAVAGRRTRPSIVICGATVGRIRRRSP